MLKFKEFQHLLLFLCSRLLNKSSMDKLSYALGMSLGQSLAASGIKDVNFDDFLSGVKSMFSNEEPALSADEGNQILNEYFDKLKKEEAIREKAEADAAKVMGEHYLRENKEKPGVQVSVSGLQYRVLKEGTGRQPGVHDRVKCNYEGRLTDGTIFDTTYKSNVNVLNEAEGKVALEKEGHPVTFLLDQVIPGWTEGVHMMKEGAVYEFTIPAKLAYGERGVPGRIPGNSVLIFTVELVEVVK